MTRVQQYLDIIFERFPVGELGGGDARDTFERLRSHCAGTDNLSGELQRLYRVDKCDDLALGLLWVTQLVEADPTKSEPTEAEEEVLFPALRKSLGLLQSELPSWESPPAVASPPEQTTEFASAPAVSEEPSLSGGFEPPVAQEEQSPEPMMTDSTATGGSGAVDTSSFGKQLEQFMEAIQGGTDDRAPMLEQITSSCEVLSADTGTPDDVRHYIENLKEFLAYISENQLLDDVRVMNLVTNIQDPFAQWMLAAEGERIGILDQATELLRDFRTMFE